MFCGKRKSWMEEVAGNDIKLILSLTNLQTQHRYFFMEYDKIPYVAHKTIALKLKFGLKRGISLTLKRGWRYTFHIIVDSFFAQVQLLMHSRCHYTFIKCFDGPGSLAPELNKLRGQGGTSGVTASLYQMMCLIENHNLCHGIFAKYRHVTLGHTVKKFDDFIYFNRAFRRYDRETVIYRYFIKGHKHSFQLIQIERSTFHDEDTLLAGVDCVYGGMFFLDDGLKTIWSQCTEVKKQSGEYPKLILRNNQIITCVVVLYAGYYLNRITFRVTVEFIEAERGYSLPTAIAASENSPNSNATNFKATLHVSPLVDSPVEEYLYLVYPAVDSSSLLHDYRITLDVPSSILLSFIPYQHTVKCAVCNIYYSPGTSYFSKEIKNAKQVSHAYKTQETQVIGLHVNTQKCREKEHANYDHGWSLLVHVIHLEGGFSRGFLETFSTLNESYALFFKQNIDLEQWEISYFDFSATFELLRQPLAPWWNVIYIETEQASVIWEMEQRITEFITKMLLEVIHDAYSTSTTYAWNSNKLQISGCKKFNIIIYAVAKKQLLFRDYTPNHYFDLHLTPYHRKSTAELRLSQNPFIFHQQR